MIKNRHNLRVGVRCAVIPAPKPRGLAQDGIPTMSVEVMSTLGWEKYSHEQFGLNRFGASGPYKKVYEVSMTVIYDLVT